MKCRVIDEKEKKRERETQGYKRKSRYSQFKIFIIVKNKVLGWNLYFVP